MPDPKHEQVPRWVPRLMRALYFLIVLTTTVAGVGAAYDGAPAASIFCAVVVACFVVPVIRDGFLWGTEADQ